jgi:hypothetical protein
MASKFKFEAAKISRSIRVTLITASLQLKEAAQL